MLISYKWYHNCTTGQCKIQGGPYYTVVNDTPISGQHFLGWWEMVEEGTHVKWSIKVKKIGLSL